MSWRQAPNRAYQLAAIRPGPTGIVGSLRGPRLAGIAACGFAVIVLALITTGQRGKASAATAATLVDTAQDAADAAEKVPTASR